MNGNDRKMDENERKMNGNERKEENHLMISQTQVYRESCACVKLSFSKECVYIHMRTRAYTNTYTCVCICKRVCVKISIARRKKYHSKLESANI